MLILALHIVFAAVLVLFFVVYGQTKYIDFRQPPATSQTAGGLRIGGSWILASRSLGDAFRALFPGKDQLVHATLALLAISLVMCIIVAIAVIIVLPRATREDSLSGAVWNAVSVIAANVPAALICIGVVGSIITIVTFYRLNRIAAGLPQRQDAVAMVMAPSVWFAALFIIRRAMRSASLLNQMAASADRPMICESCGYDLTHVSTDRRCTECGAPADDSLTNQRRRGVEWESAAPVGIREFAGRLMRTAQQLLVQPRAFFESLQVAAPAIHAQRFAIWNYALIALFSWAWLGCIFLADTVGRYGENFGKTPLWLAVIVAAIFIAGRKAALGIALIGGSMLTILICWYLPLWFSTNQGGRSDFWLVSMVAVGLTPMVGWLVHRLLGGLLSIWWFWRGEFHDARGAEKVIAYSVVFLWYPWMWFFAMFMSMIFFDMWISDFIAWTQGTRRAMLAGMYEPIAIVLGWAALVVVWIMRMMRDARRVRWANR
ncbi:MAG: hypothetical protein JNG88_03490 [Phycisphaerales bacterium]|nr:hypothetical protein [Phycisphaerales bacterium]